MKGSATFEFGEDGEMSMNAKELIAAGRLLEARTQLTAEVKAAPSDAGRRALLFQVLSFLGEWEKADRHLDMMVSLNPSSETGILTYRNLLGAEKKRTDVLHGKGTPDFLSTAPDYLGIWLAAVDKAANGRPDEAVDMIGRAETGWTTLKGTLDGRAFVGFADTDTLLRPFLVLIMHDRYIWVPFESIAELSVSPPKTLLDLLWTQARLTTWEGLNVHGYLPVRYPDTHLHEDERVKMGRETQWVSTGESLTRGVGQHVYQAGNDDVSLLDIREAAFQGPGKDR
jgi:type VI secretion system protein ImpE